MKKRTVSKLSLRRESLRKLETEEMQKVAGGARIPRTSVCNVTKGPLCDIVVPPSVGTCHSCHVCVPQ